jgi:hypothetical protein
MPRTCSSSATAALAGAVESGLELEAEDVSIRVPAVSVDNDPIGSIGTAVVLGAETTGGGVVARGAEAVATGELDTPDKSTNVTSACDAVIAPRLRSDVDVDTEARGPVRSVGVGGTPPAATGDGDG